MLYDSIGKQLSMTAMFFMFAICMAATSVLFAFIALQYKPPVVQEHTETLSANVAATGSEADSVTVSLLHQEAITEEM